MLNLVPKSNVADRDPRLLHHREVFGEMNAGMLESSERPSAAYAYDAATGCYVTESAVGALMPPEPIDFPPPVPPTVPEPFPTDNLMTHYAGFQQPHGAFHVSPRRRQVRRFARRPWYPQQQQDWGGDWEEEMIALPQPQPQLPMYADADTGDGDDFFTGRGGGGGGGGGHGGGGHGGGGFGGHGHGFGGHGGFGGGGWGWGGWPGWGGWGGWGWGWDDPYYWGGAPWGYWDGWFDPAYGYGPYLPWY